MRDGLIFHKLRQAILLDTSGFIVNTADRYLAISSFICYCTFHSHLVITDLAYCVDLDCSTSPVLTCYIMISTHNET